MQTSILLISGPVSSVKALTFSKLGAPAFRRHKQPLFMPREAAGQFHGFHVQCDDPNDASSLQIRQMFTSKAPAPKLVDFIATNFFNKEGKGADKIPPIHPELTPEVYKVWSMPVLPIKVRSFADPSIKTAFHMKCRFSIAQSWTRD